MEYFVDFTLGELDAENCIFIDETGINTGMHRGSAWGELGQPAVISVPLTHHPNTTVLGAMNLNGVVDAMVVDGGTTKAVFLTFIEKVLAPYLQPNTIIILDNLNVHRSQEVRQAFDALGVRVVYLPRYCPEFNPIELAWAYIKSKLRGEAKRTKEALIGSLNNAIGSITPTLAGSWVRHCGFTTHSL